jgi:hypothetical protein
MPQTPDEPSGQTPQEPRPSSDAAPRPEQPQKREPPPWRGTPGVSGPADGADPASASDD